MEEEELLHKALKTLEEETALDLRFETHTPRTHAEGTIDIIANKFLGPTRSIFFL